MHINILTIFSYHDRLPEKYKTVLKFSKIIIKVLFIFYCTLFLHPCF